MKKGLVIIDCYPAVVLAKTPHQIHLSHLPSKKSFKLYSGRLPFLVSSSEKGMCVKRECVGFSRNVTRKGKCLKENVFAKLLYNIKREKDVLSLQCIFCYVLSFLLMSSLLIKGLGIYNTINNRHLLIRLKI